MGGRRRGRRYRWIIRRILRNASMTGLLYPPRWFGTPGRLESVKKTHQVARVGMGPNSESAVAGLGSDICRVRVTPVRLMRRPPQSNGDPTSTRHLFSQTCV